MLEAEVPYQAAVMNRFESVRRQTVLAIAGMAS
jgi:hypothetical protein